MDGAPPQPSSRQPALAGTMEPVLGGLHPAHRPQSFELCSGPAALAMAIEALAPNQPAWRDLEHDLWCKATGADEVPGAGPSRELFPEEVALAGARSGYHVVVKHQAPAIPWREHLTEIGLTSDQIEAAYETADHAARGAGVVFQQGQPKEADVQRGIEAGHPLLLVIDGSHRHDDREPFPHWVTIVDLTEDQLMLHDPLEDGGPEEGMVSRLPAVQGFEGTLALIEVAHGNRLAR